MCRAYHTNECLPSIQSFFIEDGSEEAKICKQKMEALQKHGHYFRGFDVTEKTEFY